jgi:DUF2956 family protein
MTKIKNQQKAQSPSPEVQATAAKIAANIKKPKQIKEQTKLIEQGIQKGIEQYKKTQKSKQREADKAKKKQQKLKAQQNYAITSSTLVEKSTGSNNKLPWILLVISWLGFGVYLLF